MALGRELMAEGGPPSPQSQATGNLAPYQVRKLSTGDIDQVLCLYELTFRQTARGFLADRSAEDFMDLLSDPAAVAVGVFLKSSLVGYSLCGPVVSPPYQHNRFMRMIRTEEESIYWGLGTVVHPQHEGRLLMPRMLRLRAAELEKLGAVHVAGLVAVDNVASATILLRSGALFVGLEPDATALNFLAYGGRLKKSASLDAKPVLVSWDNQSAQTALFSEGLVAHAVRRGAHDRKLHFVPMPCDSTGRCLPGRSET